MNIQDWFEDPKRFAILAGVAGAAAMAATDIRNPLRAVQHLFVGALTATFATPVFYPIISSALSVLRVPDEYHANSAAFITGAGAIYVLEFVRVFWAKKTSEEE